MNHEDDDKAATGPKRAARQPGEFRMASATATLPGRILLGLWALLLVLLVLFQPVNAPAQEAGAAGDTVRPEDMQAGSLLLKMQAGYRVATRIDTDVDIAISGPVARTTVRQRFLNDGEEWTEAIYVFPLPDGAAVDRLRVHAGERVIEGEVRAKEEARREYEEAKSAGQRTGLVEQQRANLFTTSLANVAPGETVTVEVGYLETPHYDDGAFSLRLPTTLTPRYIPGTPIPGRRGSGWAADTDRVPDASLITPPVVVSSPHHKLTLAARIDAGVPLAAVDSRYHPIEVTPVDEDNGIFGLRLADGETPMDHDFELVWRPEAGAVPRAALFRESLDGAPYYLLMMLPPAEEQSSQPRLPRDMVFVIDTSGSMHGTSMEQAKEALLLALDGLAAGDRFNVIQFNWVTHALYPASVEASPERLALARRYVRGLQAEGGTEMRPALERALDADGDGTMLRQVIFITDGSVGNERDLIDLIEARLGDARLFTVGIGSAPNSYFMRKAAEQGRGAFTHVSALHEVRERMGALFARLERPQVTDIAVRWPGGAALAYPERVPDLYAGEPVVQKVRLAAPPRDGDIATVTGTSPGGEWRVDVPLASPGEAPGVAATWARARVEHLLERERAGEAEGARAAVVRTALEHRLVTPYTSMVAVDRTPARPAGEQLAQEQVPNLLPYGESHRAIFGFPATATGYAGKLAAGALLLLIARLLLVFRGTRLHRRALAAS